MTCSIKNSNLKTITGQAFYKYKFLSEINISFSTAHMLVLSTASNAQSIKDVKSVNVLWRIKRTLSVIRVVRKNVQIKCFKEC